MRFLRLLLAACGAQWPTPVWNVRKDLAAQKGSEVMRFVHRGKGRWCVAEKTKHNPMQVRGRVTTRPRTYPRTHSKLRSQVLSLKK